MKVTIETATTSFIEKRVKYISGVDEQAARNLLIGNANYSLKNQMGEVFFQDRHGTLHNAHTKTASAWPGT